MGMFDTVTLANGRRCPNCHKTLQAEGWQTKSLFGLLANVKEDELITRDTEDDIIILYDNCQHCKKWVELEGFIDKKGIFKIKKS